MTEGQEGKTDNPTPKPIDQVAETGDTYELCKNCGHISPNEAEHQAHVYEVHVMDPRRLDKHLGLPYTGQKLTSENIIKRIFFRIFKTDEVPETLPPVATEGEPEQPKQDIDDIPHDEFIKMIESAGTKDPETQTPEPMASGTPLQQKNRMHLLHLSIATSNPVHIHRLRQLVQGFEMEGEEFQVLTDKRL